VVLEEYPNPIFGPGRPHLLYSTTKSVTSALIGIAIDRGTIESVDQRVVDFFIDRSIANLDPRKQSLTLEHLLTMSCGFEWEGPDDQLHTWGQALASRNPIQFMLDQPMASDPGSEWYYNGGCSHLLSAILTEASGRSALDFARQYLFDPLGITQVEWPRDWQGYYFGGQDIWLTPRDMAKFGYLFLREGEWDGRQIIPADWVAQSSETRFHLGGGMGYGYQWWTLPELGAYYAAGAYEQRIYVLPDLDLVVVFTADNRVEGERPGEIRDGPPITPQWLADYVIPACEE
jgi:CubicO group peptidase (beta-lactamase class C family)